MADEQATNSPIATTSSLDAVARSLSCRASCIHRQRCYLQARHFQRQHHPKDVKERTDASKVENTQFVCFGTTTTSSNIIHQKLARNNNSLANNNRRRIQFACSREKNKQTNNQTNKATKE